MATPHSHRGGNAAPDSSYRIVIRTVLWLIAGAVFVGFALWWVMT